jgi:hypothetical protein
LTGLLFRVTASGHLNRWVMLYWARGLANILDGPLLYRVAGSGHQN